MLIRESAPVFNLIDEAIDSLGTSLGRRNTYSWTLEKHLPVASGIGGGSADAAAALKCLRAFHRNSPDSVNWEKIAGQIGSDVPACLVSKACSMRGRGETIDVLESIPELSVVLVNQRIPVQTAGVFRSIDAQPTVDSDARRRAIQHMRDANQAAQRGADAFLSFLRAEANDLEGPALRLVPEMQIVKDVLQATAGAEIVRMSGSGATWFALFLSRIDAATCARSIQSRNPDWWVAESVLI